MAGNTQNFFLDSLPFKLGQTARVGELLGRSYYKEYANKKNILELDEFVILSYIKENPKSSQAEISKKFLKGKAHIGKILNDMEQKGYILRTADIKNGIMVKHSIITKLGEKIYEETDNGYRILAKKTLGFLTEEEIETLTHLLDKYRNTLLDNFEINF